VTVSGPRATAKVVGSAVLAALPAWVVARVLVAAALVVAHLSVRSVRPDNPVALQRVHDGLLGWDAGWYRSIADHGYVAAGRESLRFFPLYPLLGRWLGSVPGVGTGVALVVVANVAALLAMAALLLLVRRDLGDTALAGRSMWLLALAPSAYSLVLAYSDAVLLLCSIVTFLGIRSRHWWWPSSCGRTGRRCVGRTGWRRGPRRCSPRWSAQAPTWCGSATASAMPGCR
jgi:hypothetical protein